MNWIAFAVVAWMLFGLELGLKPALQLGATGMAPSFVLVLLVITSMAAQRTAALWGALVIGVLLDLTSPLPVAPPRGGAAADSIVLVGPHALGCLVAAYAVLVLRAVVMKRSVLAIAFLCLIAAGLETIVAWVVITARSWYDPLISSQMRDALGARLGSAVYTGVLSLALGPALALIGPLLGLDFGGAPRTRRRYG